MKVRQLKKVLHRRWWFNKAQIWNGEVWPAKRHGLAYGDVRSHQKVRCPEVGKLALLEVPYDTMHMDRKVWKKQDKFSFGQWRKTKKERKAKKSFSDAFHDSRAAAIQMYNTADCKDTVSKRAAIYSHAFKINPEIESAMPTILDETDHILDNVIKPITAV